MPEKKTHTINIEKIVHGGDGLGRLANGMIVLVPFVLPGETVVVAERRRRKGFIQADVIEVLDPSPHRITPKCKYSYKCGGCQFQHIDYAFQVTIKKQILEESLLRAFAQTTLTPLQLDSFLASPQQFHYRQRIKLQVDNFGHVGFFRARSRQVEEVENCLLVGDSINSVLSSITTSQVIEQLLKNCQTIDLLYDPSTQQVVVMMKLLRKPRPNDHKMAKQFASQNELVKAVWFLGENFSKIGPISGETINTDSESGKISFSIPADIAGKKLQLNCEAGGFCQVNLEQNHNLIKTMLDWTRINPDQRVLDLYCGMGNFSLPIGLHAKEVFGMDSQRSSIRSALENSQINELQNCTFSQVDSHAAVKKCFDDKLQFDLLLLDPPRQGCRDIIFNLSKLSVSKILYISCDPATFARDLELLCQQGYRLEKVAGVDMFPQTHHLESVALLEKGNLS